MIRELAITMAYINLVGCTAPQSDQAGVADSAGIRIVTGPPDDLSASWRVVEVTRLGENDPEHPLSLVAHPEVIGADLTGRVVLYNELAERVEVYSPGGQLLGARGRKGGGPGEYQFPGTLTVDPDGSISLVDYGKNAIIAFDAVGNVLPQRSFATLAYPYGGIRFWGDTAILQTREATADGPVHTLRLVAPGVDTVLMTLVTATLGQAQFQCPGFTITLSGAEVLFAPELTWVVAGRTLIAAAQDRYEVRVFRGAKRSLIIRRPFAKRPVEAEHVSLLYPDGRVVGRAPCRKQAPELAAKFGVASLLPVLGRVASAPDGSVWVERYALPGDEQVMDIFSPEGVYFGTITGAGFPVGFVKGGRFVGLEWDQETGAHRVSVYRLAPPPW